MPILRKAIMGKMQHLCQSYKKLLCQVFINDMYTLNLSTRVDTMTVMQSQAWEIYKHHQLLDNPWLQVTRIIFGSQLWKNERNQFDWSWWRHQMEAFSALLALCEGNLPVTTMCIPSQSTVTLSFDAMTPL